MSSLPHRLSAMQAEHQHVLNNLQDRGTAIAEEQNQIRQQIVELRTRLKELDGEAITVQAALEQEKSAFRQREVLLRTQAFLQQSSESLIAGADFWQHVSEQQRELALLQGQSPSFEKELSDYREIEKLRPEEWQRMAGIAKRLTEARREQLIEQLAPFLQQEEALRKARTEQHFVINLLALVDESNRVIRWLLPIPRDKSTIPPQARALLEHASQTLHQAIALGCEQWNMGRPHPVEEGQGAFLVLASATEIPPAELDQKKQAESIWETLQTDPLFTGTRTDIVLNHLKQPVWHDAFNGDTTIAPLIHSWYTREDIRAWERPLRTAADSRWSEQGRRLRTLMLRMLSNGAIGESSILQHQLWYGVPEPHKEWLQLGVDQLLEHSFLLHHHQTLNGDLFVALNPTRLRDVQALIKREVTPAWEELV